MGRVKDITHKKAAGIVAYSTNGLSHRKLAGKIGVSQAAVGKIIKHHQESGGYGRRTGCLFFNLVIGNPDLFYNASYWLKFISIGLIYTRKGVFD